MIRFFCSGLFRTITRRFATFGILAAAGLSPLPASSAALAIDARANIFASGLGAVPGGDGLLPPSFGLPIGIGRLLTFSSVAGLVDCVRIRAPRFGPDGSNCTGFLGTYILSANGIAGITHDSRQMFLTGVFLDATAPTDPPPASLVFAGAGASSFADLFPGLDQPFFIGDGLTGTWKRC